MRYKKPNRLEKGDTVAVVSPSWAGPSVFPHVYENGLKVLENWGLIVKEYPSARMSSDPSLSNIKKRAKDINDAFRNSDVKAIFVSVGGDDSVRILPFLNPQVIANNPKIIMGYSDTTTLLAYINQLGLVTFNGPTIMAGFSQMENLPKAFESHVHDMLFKPSESYTYPSFGVYCEGYMDWGKVENAGKTNTLKLDSGMHVVQGRGKVTGILFGGCIEVLEFLKGTSYWPPVNYWENKVLFLETSEDKPSIKIIQRILRNYGVQGVFASARALIFARPIFYSEKEKCELEQVIKQVISVEFGQPDFPIVINAEFGHCDPQVVLPNGIQLEIDLNVSAIKLKEPCLI
ncbi:MAG: S66 peptidase family protein [Paraglaciecola sp.]|uniref:S66 family peptidase n=1 Tax=Paraglaciecola sp. TaxID=1920173 RepID=UPI003298E8B2